MSKMSTDPIRHALNGPTMGTRRKALFRMPPGFDPDRLQADLQAAVTEVNARMSTWRPLSDLMRLNTAAPGVRVDLPVQLMAVLSAASEIGRAGGGAFDIGLGAGTCMRADAWATALMVRGHVEGAAMARRHHLNALFIGPEGVHLCETPVGPLFEVPGRHDHTLIHTDGKPHAA